MRLNLVVFDRLVEKHIGLNERLPAANTFPEVVGDLDYSLGGELGERLWTGCLASEDLDHDGYFFANNLFKRHLDEEEFALGTLLLLFLLDDNLFGLGNKLVVVTQHLQLNREIGLVCKRGDVEGQ